ncbi:1240_t:CDS:2, partial [Gigaspora rosea]
SNMDESNVQDTELEALVIYDSTEELSDNDSDGLGLSREFYEKYAAAKGYGVRIGGENMKPNGMSSRRDKNCLEVTTLNDQHVGHELHPSTRRFDLILRKLLKNVIDEVPPAKEDTATLLKRLYEKIEDPQWFIVISSNTLVSTSKTHFLPTQFIELSKFDTGTLETLANSGSGQSYKEITKTISKKRKFGEIWGLGRKIIVNAIEDSNDDIYHEVLEFFLSIQSKTLQRIVNNNMGNDFNHSIDKLNDSTMDIQNPIERWSRGHSIKTCKEKKLSDINSNKENDKIESADGPSGMVFLLRRKFSYEIVDKIECFTSNVSVATLFMKLPSGCWESEEIPLSSLYLSFNTQHITGSLR